MARYHATVGSRSPAAETLGDGGAVVGVAAEHLRDEGGLVRDDLVAGAGQRALADVPSG